MPDRLMQRNLETGLPLLDWFAARACVSRFMVGVYIVSAGLAGFAIANGHTTTGAVEHISQQLGQKSAEASKLKALVKCEDTRADRASVVAGQAIVANVVGTIKSPTAAEIPADNCPHPK